MTSAATGPVITIINNGGNSRKHGGCRGPRKASPRSLAATWPLPAHDWPQTVEGYLVPARPACHLRGKKVVVTGQSRRNFSERARRTASVRLRTLSFA
jgi:hypothetical protein